MMEFESSILFFAMVYRFIAYSRASAIRKKQIMAKRAFSFGQSTKKPFRFINAFWVLTAAMLLGFKEANLLRKAKRVWSIERPQQWFDRL